MREMGKGGAKAKTTGAKKQQKGSPKNGGKESIKMTKISRTRRAGLLFPPVTRVQRKIRAASSDQCPMTSFETVVQSLQTNDATPPPRQKLPSLDLQGVAAFIREERPRIVFMVGAGISTSAGIPDFRTPGTGLYDNLKQYNIPRPQAIFELDYFKKCPEPFFVLAKELFHENIRPTPVHHFICLVEEKGLLRRCFTQNIDSLEYQAGIKDDKIVAAHGSHRTSTCLSCRKKYGHEWLMAQIKNAKTKVPKCENCKKGVVKPDIVFFGENLPSRFFSNSLVDLPKCELLIIIGTSLVVQPFASLVDKVPNETPRLLINLEAVRGDLLRYQKSDNIRDVFWKGQCDEGIRKLARLLGWEDELNAMINMDRASTEGHQIQNLPYTVYSIKTRSASDRANKKDSQEIFHFDHQL